MTPEQDAKQAEKILRAWITDKTGTTDVQRAMFKIVHAMALVGDSFEKIAQAVEEVNKKFKNATEGGSNYEFD